ncbi:MAG: zinc ribbon domain-containing protein [Burkholderiaceae bacterium]|nr:zinc ribbon domain-containing protein [Burkholderiaceae bacterium]
MPIYAYRCAACGHAKDVLQKVSDPLLSVCPACGADSFQKQVTAAGFQLKGSGWYVTDFRDGAKPASPADKPSGDAKPSGGALAGHAEKPASSGATSKTESAKSSAPAAPASAPSAPASGSAPAPSPSSN